MATPAAYQMQFFTTGQHSLREGCKIVGYGRAGIGKTRLLATAPRPFVVAAERGTLSLRRENIPGCFISSHAAYVEFIRWAKGSNEAKNFDTFGIDSMSDICETLLAHEKIANTDKKNGFAPYNKLFESTMNDMRTIRDIPQKHVYFICKEEYEKDAATGMFMFGPSLPGRALSNEIPYFVDEIFRFVDYKDQQNQTQVCLQTRLNNVAVAKDRSGALDEYEYPNLTSIFNKMMS